MSTPGPQPPGGGSGRAPVSGSNPTPGAAGSNRVDEVLELVSGQDPARGRKRAFKAIGVGIGLFLLGMVASFEVSHYLESRHSKADAERDDRNNDAIEDAKKPFDWKINYSLDNDEPGYAWVLDRRLSAAEGEQLKSLGEDRKKIWEFVRGRGGWRNNLEDVYKLQLTSEKSKPVTITKMTARATTCKKGLVKTKISVGLGGLETPDQVHFNISEGGAGSPPMTWEKSGQDEGMTEVPYTKVVALGGTQTPGFLSVTPRLTQDMVCDWTLSFDYNVNSGASQTAEITKEENGKALRATGKAGDGADKWEWINGKWSQSRWPS